MTLLPKGRDVLYAKWKACERFGIIPPEMGSKWDEMDIWQRALLIAYNQVRDYEEQEERNNELKFLGGVKM